ncbi:MAG: DNA primase small subunit PriS [Natronomonas sp.]
MDGRTREYLKGRFGDHYRQTELSPPPAADEREWGYITWSGGTTTMVRHSGYIDLVGGGGLEEFLAGERPRHVYFSAGRYDRPDADTMSEKGWRGSDLVFDLDADHLPDVDPETDSYAEMLSSCKDALLRLLDLLKTDFGFTEPTVVFSGGRGYHVHVRRSDVQDLGRSERREIVDYLLGDGVTFEDVVETETVSGAAGRSSPAQRRELPAGGWAGRTRDRLDAFCGDLLADEDAAVERLREFDGIGTGKAEAILRVARENREAIAAGNIDVHPAVYSIAQRLFEETLEAESAPIDEPVTTDINRLIRLPGSLHGGSGLAVRRIDPDDLAAFDPLVDAVPETFKRSEILIDVTESVTVELCGESFSLSETVHSVPEYIGIFAMTRGHARKAAE